MFTRLRAGAPVLLPHGGLVVTSYGHVDDLCAGLLGLGRHPEAAGQVVNLTGGGVTALQYVATLAEVVGVEPHVVPVPDHELPRLTQVAPLPWSHLFAGRHHGLLSTAKAEWVLGLPVARDFTSGHAETYEWFCRSTLADGATARSDATWGAGFDLGSEARVAASLGAP